MEIPWVSSEGKKVVLPLNMDMHLVCSMGNLKFTIFGGICTSGNQSVQILAAMLSTGAIPLASKICTVDSTGRTQQFVINYE